MTIPRRLPFAWLLAAGACGSFGGSDTSPSTPAPEDAGTVVDAAVPVVMGEDGGAMDAGTPEPDGSTITPVCNPSAPFGSPSVVKGAPASVAAFKLTADGKHAYFDDGKGALSYAPLFAPDSLGPLAPLTITTAMGGNATGVSLSDDETVAFFEQGSPSGAPRARRAGLTAIR